MATESKNTDLPELSIVQQWFHSVVTHPEGIEQGVNSSKALDLIPMSRNDLEHMVTRSEKVSAHDRMNIYANAYYARLIECLGESYPVMKRTLGEEAFNGFCFAYLQEYPSTSYTLGHLGDNFERFLTDTRPDADDPQLGWPDLLIDLARLEWTILQVFDGPGIEKTTTLQLTDLQAIKPDQWLSVKLQLVPCLELLALHYPLNEYYTDARQQSDDTKIDIPEAKQTFLAITRRDYIVRRHEISSVQYILLSALKSGHTLGDALERAAARSSLNDEALANELQHWFREWVEFSFF